MIQDLTRLLGLSERSWRKLRRSCRRRRTREPLPIRRSTTASAWHQTLQPPGFRCRCRSARELRRVEFRESSLLYRRDLKRWPAMRTLRREFPQTKHTVRRGDLPLVCTDENLQCHLKGLDYATRTSNGFLFNQMLNMINEDLSAAGYATLPDL